MQGPFDLNQNVIDTVISPGLPGNYAYGYIDPEDGCFVVEYVGRSDTDLHARIGHGIGKYKKFTFSLANSVQDAYTTECINWHEFGGEEGLLDNKIHPDKPSNGFAICPICAKKLMDKIIKKN